MNYSKHKVVGLRGRSFLAGGLVLALSLYSVPFAATNALAAQGDATDERAEVQRLGDRKSVV